MRILQRVSPVVMLLLLLMLPRTVDAATIDQFRAAFKSPPREFSQVPFWFWNDEITEEGIRDQIAKMEAKGVYGFTIHARLGLSSAIPYMGERWLQLVGVAVEEAARRNMQVYLYDEGMYPSGSAHGRVVAADPKFASQGLRMAARHFSGSREVAVEWAVATGEQPVAAVMVQKDPASGKYLRATSSVLSQESLSALGIPQGDWTVFLFTQTPSGGRIRGVHDGEEDNQPGAPASADLLNAAATAHFIAETHERYYQALSRHFGRTIRAIFTDEPNILGRRTKPGLVPWTWGFLDRLNTSTGRDFATSLPFLWVEASDRSEAAVRSQFNSLVAAALNESYYKPISDWCAAHKVALTGHPAGSGEMAPLLHFQIPGQDVVWRYVVPGGPTALEGIDSTIGKSATSIAVSLSRPIVTNELYGAYGWQLTMDEMKWLADWLFVRGTNILLPHAFYYSVRGERLHERPPDVGWNNVWWEHYGQLTAYTNRLSWLLTGGTPVAPVAILATSDQTPWRAARVLFQNQKDFFYLHDSLLAAARVEGGQLKSGACSYSVIVIDGLETANEPLLNQLLRCLDGGVAVIAFDSRLRTAASEDSTLAGKVTKHPRFVSLRADARGLTEQVDAVAPKDLAVQPSAPWLRYCHRIHDGFHFYMLVNEGDERIQTSVGFSQKTRPEIWDAETGSMRNAEEAVIFDGQVNLPLDLWPRQSMIVVFDPSSAPPGQTTVPGRSTRTEIAIPFVGWRLQLGDAAEKTTRLGSWTDLPEARSFSGTGWYRRSIQAPDGNLSKGARVFLECGSILGFGQVRINGKSAGVRLWAPYRFDVTDLIKPGKNLIEVGVTNTRANKLLPQKFDAGLGGPVRLVIEK